MNLKITTAMELVDMKPLNLGLPTSRSMAVVIGMLLSLLISFLATTASAQSTPETLFTTQTPSEPANFSFIRYELGTKFRATQNGRITAVRYWKSSGDFGTHVGRIWNASGTQLTSVTFSGESGSGWQRQVLPIAIAITANTTYVVSVNTISRLPKTPFGLSSVVSNGSLRSIADGNNGVYNSPAGRFPIFSSQNSNYFRDIEFIPDVPPTITKASGDAQTGNAGAALQNPLVVRITGTNGLPQAGTVVTFSVTAGGGTISPATATTNASGLASTSLTLGPGAGSNTVSASATGIGSVGFSATATVVATITKVSGDGQSANPATTLPNPLVIRVTGTNGLPQADTAVTFSISGGGGTISPLSATTDASGLASTSLTLGSAAGTNTVNAAATGIESVTFNATATAVVTTKQSIFTTQAPAQPDVSDGVPYELGMKFSSAKSGSVTAIRYFKAASDTGTHTGRIWSAAGTLLASATFNGETASGWQEQALATPLTISANTTYVVSVNVTNNFAFTNGGLATSIVNGDLSSVADGANGVFGSPSAFPTSSFQNSNYFRDIVFEADAISTITKVSGDGQTGLPATQLAGPLIVQINDANNNPRSGVNVNFSVASGGGTLTPSSATTGTDGRASATWTLGTAGNNSVSINAPGIGSVTFTAVAGPNAIYLENLKPGTTAWRSLSTTYTTTEIAAYAGALSVQRGGSLPFKVSLAQPDTYSIDVYRFGYYGGTGGRLVASSGNLSGVTQPTCPVTDVATRLVECNWSTGYTLSIGTDWTSGLYMAKLKRASTGKETPVFFVVRDDSSTASVLFQSSFTTSAAYNRYGGYSLYDFSSTGGQRAFKISFDRPSKELDEYSNVLRYEYNMIRWMESQGYDVTYVTNLDIHVNPSLLAQHRVFLDVGHDEYWSLEMRNAVENARNSGMNLAFFSANTAYWRVRFEPSSAGAANRVMVCYKAPGDPVTPTERFRDPSTNRPENALMGVMYIGDHGALYGGFDFVVANASDPYFANTGLNNGDKLVGLVGYEWDAIVNNGFTPAGVVTLASSLVTPQEIAPGIPTTATQISHSVRYTAPGGGKVFSTGSIQWIWSLDSGDGISPVNPSRVDARAQQIFVNILSDMGARPTTPNPGLIVP